MPSASIWRCARWGARGPPRRPSGPSPPIPRAPRVLRGGGCRRGGAGPARAVQERGAADAAGGLGGGRVVEGARHVGEPFDVGDAREVEVAPVRLRLAGERLLQVRVTLGALEALACHDSFPPLSRDGRSTAWPAARAAPAVELGAVIQHLEAGA